MEAVRLEKKERYSYADYCKWSGEERWELIDGIAYALAAPSIDHQRVCKRIFRQLDEFLDGKPCDVFFAPCDVRLNAEGADDDVVQPDIFVVCDEKKLEDGKSVVGAPDMVIEVLSPTTASYDRLRKYMLYQRAGVKEYWIVDPDEKALTVNLLQNGRYWGVLYIDEYDTVPVDILHGCTINFDTVFNGL